VVAVRDGRLAGNLSSTGRTPDGKPAWADAAPKPPDVHALAARTMERLHLIYRGGGSLDALVHW
jgi:hypothetical protein